VDKEKIVAAIVLHFQKEIEVYERISAQAREDAISSENKQEGVASEMSRLFTIPI
jgi:uncharacterized protein YbjQ (UPF0145 family)